MQEEKSATLATNNDQYLFEPVGYDARGNGDGKTAPTITGDHNDRITDYTALAVTLDCRNAAVNDELSGTLQAKPNGGFSHNCINPVAYGIGNGQADGLYLNDKCPTLNCMHDPQAVIDTHYIVRRLTPTECARLQGFPDWWCDNIAVPNPAEEQMQEWREIFETHRRIVTHAAKPKTDNQIKKFLAHPRSDAAEYKLWGNGIALPCAVRVMQGIVHLMEDESL